GKQQEFYQTNDQLKHVDEKGASTAIDKATFTGLRRPIDFIYIPSGEQRTFELAYLVPATETKPRLAYASVTKGGSKVLVLPEIAAIPVASAGAPQLPTIPSGTTQPTAPSARAAIEAHP
ncbi:MAG: von Willebrand factor type domain protein, partial [Bryobacterales bacterium]|nr:von Willebrand factor type domain protein [Bryobacterales bacterium]